MQYTVRYSKVGYHSQSYRFDDIECNSVEEAISMIDFHGDELASDTVILYKELPNDSDIRCFYDTYNKQASDIRKAHEVGVFTGKFVSFNYGYGGYFNMDGVNDVNNWSLK